MAEFDPNQLYQLGAQIGGVLSGKARRQAQQDRLREQAEIERMDLILKGMRTQQKLNELNLQHAPERLEQERQLFSQQQEAFRLSKEQQDFQNRAAVRSQALATAKALEGAPGEQVPVSAPPNMFGAGVAPPLGSVESETRSFNIPGLSPPGQEGGGLEEMMLQILTGAGQRRQASEESLAKAQQEFNLFAAQEQLKHQLKLDEPFLGVTGRGVSVVDRRTRKGGIVSGTENDPKPKRQSFTLQEAVNAKRIVDRILESLNTEAPLSVEDFQMTIGTRRAIESMEDLPVEVLQKRRKKRDDTDELGDLANSSGFPTIGKKQ